MARNLSVQSYFMKMGDTVLELTDLLGRDFTGTRPVNLGFTRLDIESPNNPNNIYGCAIVIGGDVEIANITGAVWYNSKIPGIEFPTKNIRRVFNQRSKHYGILLATCEPCDPEGKLGRIHYYSEDDRIRGACEEIAGRISLDMQVIGEFDKI